MRRVLLGTACTGLALGLSTGLTANRLHAQPPPGPALTVTGTLVDEQGAPAAGLDLELRPSPSRYERRLEDLGESDPLSEVVDSTRSGPDGAFTLTAPAVGPYRLDISAPSESAAPEARGVAVAPVSHSLAPLAAPTVLPPIEVPNWHTLTVGAKDLEGRPVEGALVVADPVLWRSERAEANAARPRWNQPRQRIYPRFWRAAARTDATGVATFSMPTAEVNAFVSAQGFRLRAGPVGDRGGVFELTPGHGVTVRVLDPRGRPAPRAVVTVGESQDVPLALTDERGQATVGLTSDQSLIYQAIAEDHSLAWTAPLGPEASDAGVPANVEVRLRPPAEIAGRVTDKSTGGPVPGAAIWHRPGEQTRSGPGGAFVLRTWLHRGRAQVGIAADGYQATSAMVTAERIGSADGVDIALAPAALLGGQVVDAAGRPVAGAYLWIEPTGQSGGWSIGPGTWRATSAADGRFFVSGVASGHTYRLHAEADSYAPGTISIPAAPAGSTRKPVRLVLTRGRLVQGAITDTHAAPIAGAEVALLPVAVTGAGGYSQNIAARRTSTTDARGVFEFAGTPPGRHQLTASHPEYVSVRATAFEVPPGEGTKDVGILTLDVGAAIEGVVRDFQRRPVRGAQVKVHQNNIDHLRPLDPEIRTALTETDGTFRIAGLRAEPADLVVEAEGYERLEVNAVSPQAGRLIEVQLGEGARLAGRVLDADGEGVANAYIWLRLDRKPGLSRTAWSPEAPRHDATTDSDGRFLFEALGAGPWLVDVGGEQLAEDIGAIPLRPGEEREIELHLSARAHLAGVVTDPYGEPVTGAEILVQPRDAAGQVTGTHHSARTDAGGGYQAYRVPSGPARIVARHPDYRDGVAEVVIDGGTNEVDLKLQPGWEISGTVTTAAGAPLALARVEAYLSEPPASLDDLADARRQVLPRVPLEAVTDQSGNYRIGGLDHGRYELRAHADGYARAASGRFPVRVAGVSVAGVDFVLHRGITLRGAVTGRPPEAFAGISVRAAQERLLGGITTPDLEGGFELDALGPGRWTVSAEEADGRRVERSVTLETGPGEAFVELRFEPGFTLTGEVLSQGRPSAGGEVYVVEGTTRYGPGRTARIDQQGRFHIDGLAAGSYKVMIAEQNGVTHSRKIELQADQDIFVDLDPPAVLAGTVIDAVTREPVAGANLVAIVVDPEAELAPGAEEEWIPAGFTQSNANGEYRLEFAPRKATSLMVQRQGYDGFGVALDLAPGERRGGFLIELKPRVAAPSVPASNPTWQSPSRSVPSRRDGGRSGATRRPGPPSCGPGSEPPTRRASSHRRSDD
ncbi:MAG: carboxypeptidase regulatory-like domain-containing protein [Acidobacteriota bacterium]|nr:carboxypeptidase regulatory-like domain-containing protein [Acidobacteriota bacterium]